MATAKKTQRIAIFIIMIVMVVGTLGSFFVIILENDNQKDQAKRQQAAMADYQKSMDDYQEKLDAQASELSKKYYPTFSQYKDLPAKFELEGVDKLVKKDLKIGSGKQIEDDTKFAAYYIGWTPDGKIFDQSIENEALKPPLDIRDGLANASLIDGWKQGMKGMKIGGVRLLEIPSDLAYGETGQGEDIPPNTPLKFVVMAIELPKQIEQPEIPDELSRGLY